MPYSQSTLGYGNSNYDRNADQCFVQPCGRIFCGRIGESQMGAISIVYPLGQVVVGLGLLFGNGAASYISRLLGQEKEEQANKVASTFSLLQFNPLGIISHSLLRRILEADFNTSRCNQKHSSLRNDLCRNLHNFLYLQCI